ncbi:MAG: hypothetical protein LBM64_01385 [Deltaproteobacteria bacterium]|jgi:hypothetical protein|nr:hypothetical protein [Deltaproteobacteria bacterium]
MREIHTLCLVPGLVFSLILRPFLAAASPPPWLETGAIYFSRYSLPPGLSEKAPRIQTELPGPYVLGSPDLAASRIPRPELSPDAQGPAFKKFFVSSRAPSDWFQPSGRNRAASIPVDVATECLLLENAFTRQLLFTFRLNARNTPWDSKRPGARPDDPRASPYQARQAARGALVLPTLAVFQQAPERRPTT